MKKFIIFLICLILLMIGIVTFVFLKDSNSGDTGDNGEVVTDESNFAERIRITIEPIVIPRLFLLFPSFFLFSFSKSISLDFIDNHP